MVKLWKVEVSGLIASDAESPEELVDLADARGSLLALLEAGEQLEFSVSFYGTAEDERR